MQLPFIDEPHNVSVKYHSSLCFYHPVAILVPFISLSLEKGVGVAVCRNVSQLVSHLFRPKGVIHTRTMHRGPENSDTEPKMKLDLTLNHRDS